MGGGDALRWSLGHGELFEAAASVAPAAYATALPLGSSTRTSMAFAAADSAFDERRWRSLMSYRHRLDVRSARAGTSRFTIVVSDSEPLEEYAAGLSSLTVKASRLHHAQRAAPQISSALRVVAGAHGQSFWLPALTQSLALLDR